MMRSSRPRLLGAMALAAGLAGVAAGAALTLVVLSQNPAARSGGQRPDRPIRRTIVGGLCRSR